MDWTSPYLCCPSKNQAVRWRDARLGWLVLPAFWVSRFRSVCMQNCLSHQQGANKIIVLSCLTFLSMQGRSRRGKYELVALTTAPGKHPLWNCVPKWLRSSRLDTSYLPGMQRSLRMGSPMDGERLIPLCCGGPTHDPCGNVCWGCLLKCSLLLEGVLPRGWSGAKAYLLEAEWHFSLFVYIIYHIHQTWLEHRARMKTKTSCKLHGLLKVQGNWHIVWIPVESTSLEPHVHPVVLPSPVGRSP